MRSDAAMPAPQCVRERRVYQRIYSVPLAAALESRDCHAAETWWRPIDLAIGRYRLLEAAGICQEDADEGTFSHGPPYARDYALNQRAQIFISCFLIGLRSRLAPLMGMRMRSFMPADVISPQRLGSRRLLP